MCVKRGKSQYSLLHLFILIASRKIMSNIVENISRFACFYNSSCSSYIFSTYCDDLKYFDIPILTTIYIKIMWIYKLLFVWMLFFVLIVSTENSENSFDQSRNYFNVTWSVVQIRSTERNNAIRSESQKTESHTISVKISQLFFFLFCSNKDDVDIVVFCRFLLIIMHRFFIHTGSS